MNEWLSQNAVALVGTVLAILGAWYQVRDARIKGDERREAEHAAHVLAWKEADAKLELRILAAEQSLIRLDRAVAVQEEWERSMRETARELKAVVEALRERRR